MILAPLRSYGSSFFSYVTQPVSSKAAMFFPRLFSTKDTAELVLYATRKRPSLERREIKTIPFGKGINNEQVNSIVHNYFASFGIDSEEDKNLMNCVFKGAFFDCFEFIPKDRGDMVLGVHLLGKGDLISAGAEKARLLTVAVPDRTIRVCERGGGRRVDYEISSEKVVQERTEDLVRMVFLQAPSFKKFTEGSTILSLERTLEKV